MRSWTRSLAVSAVFIAAGALSQAATITIDAGAGLAGNAPALAAFNRAANTLGSLFSDPILVTINANLVSIGSPGIIGQASSAVLGAGYNFIRDQMVADAADEADDAIVASLPTAAGYNTFINSGFSLDGNIMATKANLKALGFAGLDAIFGASDATIEFNTQFAFDYDRSNGISAGTVDFESVALHEIGHALGFTSAVDDLDFAIRQGQTFAATPTTLDLFRFPATSTITSANFGTAPRSLVASAEAKFSDGTNSYRLSTGVFTGDGRQASHWKDDILTGSIIGMMDPTLASAEIFPLTVADLRAFDLIGWDINTNPIPEPETFALMGAGLAALGWYRRRTA